MSDVTMPAWKRRRFERLGITLPEEHPEPSQTVAEHSASLGTLRALEELERIGTPTRRCCEYDHGEPA